jgi:hypothetical protein
LRQRADSSKRRLVKDNNRKKRKERKGIEGDRGGKVKDKREGKVCQVADDRRKWSRRGMQHRKKVG